MKPLIDLFDKTEVSLFLDSFDELEIPVWTQLEDVNECISEEPEGSDYYDSSYIEYTQKEGHFNSLR